MTYTEKICNVTPISELPDGHSAPAVVTWTLPRAWQYDQKYHVIVFEDISTIHSAYHDA